MRHLENGQRLDEELRCRLGNALQLLRAPVGLENIEQHGVMDSGQIKDAEVLADRPSAKLIGRPAAPFEISDREITRIAQLAHELDQSS